MSAGAVSVTAGTPAAPEREGHILQVEERGGVHAPGTRGGRGPLRGKRIGRNVTALMNTLCMRTEEGAVPCTLTAATSLHVVTHSVLSAQHDYNYVRIGVQCVTDIGQ